MREILFRGKRLDTLDWIDGDLLHNYFSIGDTCICLAGEWEVHSVIHESVGQYTGLTDKNGTKIFEGDIMRLCAGTYPCIVYWDGLGWAWKQNGKRRDIDLTREKMSIVGNIHDNPELLRGEK